MRSRSLRQSDDRAQPALADRLHLPQGHRLGLVLPVHRLDDFSRYILAWKLCTTMAATDVSDTLQAALQASGLDQVKVLHRPRLLSDNGPSYLSSEQRDLSVASFHALYFLKLMLSRIDVHVALIHCRNRHHQRAGKCCSWATFKCETCFASSNAASCALRCAITCDRSNGGSPAMPAE